MSTKSILPLAQFPYLNWSGIAGAIKNREQRNQTVLARFANLDSSSRRAILTTLDPDQSFAAIARV